MHRGQFSCWSNKRKIVLNGQSMRTNKRIFTLQPKVYNARFWLNYEESSPYQLFCLLNHIIVQACRLMKNYLNNGLFVTVNICTNTKSSFTNVVTIAALSLIVTGFENWAHFLLLPAHNISCLTKVKFSLEQATKAHGGGQMYSSTLPSTSALHPRERTILYIGGWVGPMAGCGKSHPPPGFDPGPSSP